MTGIFVEFPFPGLSAQDQLTYLLVRLSEALHRLNEGMVWAGASPGEFGALVAAPEFGGSDLAIDIAHASKSMRRFADLMFVTDADAGPQTERSVWEDLLLALRVLLAACAEETDLWLAEGEDALPNPVIATELRATVYAVERLCGHFERVH